MDQKDNQIEIEDFFQQRRRFDSYSMFLQSPQNHLPKIDCMVTLGQFDLDEDENALNNIQIEQPEMQDFHLVNIFDEQKQFEQKKQVKVRKESSSIPSFMEEIEQSMHSCIEKNQHFQEMNKFQDALNNIDNFLFLETAVKEPHIFKTFKQRYLQGILKIRQYRQSQRMDLKLFMQLICDIGLNFIQDMFTLIQHADSGWCFDVIKNENQMPPSEPIKIVQEPELLFQKQTYQQQPQQIQIPQLQVPQIQVPQQPLYVQQPQVYQSSESQGSYQPRDDFAEKKGRKTWTAKELHLLQNSLVQYQNNNIPNQVLTQLAKQLGRSWCSVQSKLQKLRRIQQDQNDNNSMSNLKPESIKMKSTRYEYTVEDMIKISLQQIGKSGTKQQIINQIVQQFFNGQVPEDSPLYRSISITLSSNKNSYIRKVKGTFGLSQFRNEVMEDDNKMRNKLLWILSNFPNQRATMQQILQIYIQGQVLDELAQKKLQKQINQALLTCRWFDKSSAKTIYVLDN